MEEETSESPLTYIYNKIVPNEVPDKGWLLLVDTFLNLIFLSYTKMFYL